MYKSLLLIVAIFFAFALPSFALDSMQFPEDFYNMCDAKLVKNLDDNNVEKRTDAAVKLAAEGCPIVQDKLIDMARNEKMFQARIVAIVALTKIGDEQAIDIFREQLKVEKRKTVRTVLNGALRYMESRMIASAG